MNRNMAKDSIQTIELYLNPKKKRCWQNESNEKWKKQMTINNIGNLKMKFGEVRVKILIYNSEETETSNKRIMRNNSKFRLRYGNSLQ